MYKILLACICCFVAANSYAANPHDPTRPYGMNVISELLPPGVRVSSILISKDRKVAVIGGRYVTVGETLLGAKVVDIQPYAVYLQGPPGIFTIPILSDAIKQSAKVDGELKK